MGIYTREFLLYSLKAGDLGVCKVNLRKNSGSLKRCWVQFTRVTCA